MEEHTKKKTKLLGTTQPNSKVIINLISKNKQQENNNKSWIIIFLNNLIG